MSPNEHRPGRRSAVRRSLSPTAVLAVLLPLLTLGALALVRPAPVSVPERAAEQVRPERVDLVCPSGEPGSEAAVAAAGRSVGGQGKVISYSPRDIDPSPVDLVTDGVATIETPRVVRLRGTGPVAPKLIGSRVDTDGLAAAECVLPRPEYWFTGLGADADHASQLELSNPDEGPAVADVTVWGRTGRLDVPTLRGVTVSGGDTTRLDLAEVLPRRSELAVQVEVSRGRLAASVSDRIPPLGTRPETQDWLPATPEPSTEQLLLGLSRGEGADTLVVSNPGEDEARVELRIVTEDAAFAPEGAEEIRVSPGSVEEVALTDTVRAQAREGALGLLVTSTAPVTSTLRSVVDGDLVHAAPVAPAGGRVTALVPPGESRLVLARAGGAGVATVTAYDAQGKRLTEQRVELSEGSGGTVGLPERTRLVRVRPRRTDVAAAVVASGDGTTAIPLRELVRTALVPDVRPGLP